MVFGEDLQRVFGRAKQSFGATEVSVFGIAALVVSGHKGLVSISEEEIVVRLKEGVLKVTGCSLSVKKASPNEIFIIGRIGAVEYPAPLEGEASS